MLLHHVHPNIQTTMPFSTKTNYLRFQINIVLKQLEWYLKNANTQETGRVFCAVNVYTTSPGRLSVSDNRVNPKVKTSIPTLKFGYCLIQTCCLKLLYRFRKLSPSRLNFLYRFCWTSCPFLFDKLDFQILRTWASISTIGSENIFKMTPIQDTFIWESIMDTFLLNTSTVRE